MPTSTGSSRIALALGLITATVVLGCHEDLHLVRRQRTDTWQSAANSTNPAIECAPYSYAPVQAMVKTYPTIWEIANLSQSGTDPLASTLYNQLSPSIPKIKVKGTPTGDFSATTPSYSRSDPDCWWTFSNCTTPKLSGLSRDVSSCPEPSTWDAYYDYLRQANQKATLFYIGSNVIDWPLEAQRGLADGHEICAHTWSHRYMTGLTNEQVFAELYFSKKIIKEVLGVTVQCWRPPFGDVDDRRFATLGQAAVNTNYQNIIDKGTKGAFSTHGTIVLTHELNADTMLTNQNFLPKIGASFKYITPVSVCQNNTQPYVETNFTYPNFEQWAAGTRTVQLQAPTAIPNAFVPLPIQAGTSTVSQLPNAYATASSSSGGSSARNSKPANSGTAKVASSVGILVSAVLGCLALSA